MKQIILDPGQKIGLTSDTHVGHANIIQYCLRPFLTAEERRRVAGGEKIRISPETLEHHDDAIVERTNAILGPDDVLIHAGDVAWGDKAMARYADRLLCKHVYVAVGNHDDEKDLARIFGTDRVAERFLFVIGDQKVVVDHYPGDAWDQSHRGSYQLYGHVHGVRNATRRRDPRWSQSIDIGVDSHDFRPWTWDELTLYLNGRKPEWEIAMKSQVDKESGGMAPDGSP